MTSALALGLALAGLSAAPASATSPYVASVKSPSCTHTGGTYGYGKLAATAEFNEIRTSGTNYFQSIASIQTKQNNAWVAWSPSSKARSGSFPDDSLTHYWTTAWEYSFAASDVGHTYRLKLVYVFWHEQSGPDSRLAKLTRYAPAC